MYTRERETVLSYVQRENSIQNPTMYMEKGEPELIVTVNFIQDLLSVETWEKSYLYWCSMEQMNPSFMKPTPISVPINFLLSSRIFVTLLSKVEEKSTSIQKWFRS